VSSLTVLAQAVPQVSRRAVRAPRANSVKSKTAGRSLSLESRSCHETRALLEFDRSSNFVTGT